MEKVIYLKKEVRPLFKKMAKINDLIVDLAQSLVLRAGHVVGYFYEAAGILGLALSEDTEQVVASGVMYVLGRGLNNYRQRLKIEQKNWEICRQVMDMNLKEAEKVGQSLDSLAETLQDNETSQ